jgi:hypothetical protein
MPDIRRKPPFWRRREPRPCYDIACLRPSSLPKGEHFETKQDVRYESERSELLLKTYPGYSRSLTKSLCDCREGDIICDRPYCPLCGRVFRRWLIGELLRVAQKHAHKPIHILTVLLARSEKINALDLKPWRHALRKRLLRAGLGNASVIGGFEIVYKQSSRAWVLHVNLVVIGGTQAGLDKFKAASATGVLDRPFVCVPLQDLAEQLSYILKFTTYHRPRGQLGAMKGPAVPLNPPEHHTLVTWMSQYEFQDFLFLFNAYRKDGTIIKLKKHIRSQA